MKTFRRIMGLLLSTCIVLTMALSVQAQGYKTLDQMAASLNRLTLLAGSGNNYNLDGKLKKCEAAAFMVRMLGKEKYVFDNKAQFSQTKFSDVPSNKWFAPYVGYCVKEGIISGLPDNTFRPDESISEKSFLVMAIGTLGYKANTDFNWNTIYSKAHEVGLVSGDFYLVSNNDNVNYQRKEVVYVLYNMLDKKNKSTGISVVQNLINNNIVTKPTVQAEGLSIDELATAISSVSVVNSTKIKVTFNENIAGLSSDSIRIFETQNTSNKLTASVESVSAKEAVITTSAQAENKAYSIQLENVTDSLGNTVPLVTSTFTGYYNPVITSDFFKISMVETVSKNVLNVYFTQPINLNAELPMNYEILQNSSSLVKGSFSTMSVKTIRELDNAVSIFLKDTTLTEGTPYVLKVSGDLNSAYSVKLKDGSGDQRSFTGKGSENAGFSLVSVLPFNEKTILVEFNRDVDQSTALIRDNYTIVNSSGVPVTIQSCILSSDSGQKGRVVKLSLFQALDKTKSYEVTIKNVKDAFGQITMPDSKYPFPGQTIETIGLKVVNVFAEDRGTIGVYFDKPLDPAEAIRPNNYNITPSGGGAPVQPFKVYYEPSVDPYLVKLFMPTGNELSGSQSYSLKVFSTLKDIMGNMSPAAIDTPFSGNGTEFTKPFVSEAKIIAKDAILVRFTKELNATGTNASTVNYRLEYKEGETAKFKTPSTVSFVNATTIVLKFDSLNFATAYTLKFTTTLNDYSNQYTRLVSDPLNAAPVYLGAN